MSKDKPYAGGRWTTARKNSFIKSLLRSGSRRWPPLADAKRSASVRRGVYLCKGFNHEPHEVLASTKLENGKRVSNAIIDHIDSVVPTTGFTDWNDVIERMFVEADKLQVLCKDCHDLKTQQEREQRKANVTNE